ncbi:sugar phosphate isomerase/epimerase family protein [Agromyces silvae]|uniref:sugar phosphate isomerase/epimerase family protein n=1 Tax=Agromyces silvae TaxID=3388266 RepID=UPI00280BC7D2|nr:sugar phosphate isomerase/epimerase family protein [Agromyces protaetiae]
MRIAAFPKAFLHELIVDRSMTIFEWIELARTLGVDGLELHPGFFHEGGRAEIDAVGEALADAGFEMPMLCASPDFTHPDAAQRARERDHQADAIRLAAALGGDAPTCRVLSGQAHPQVAVEQGLDWATEAIEELLPLARELGVALCLENHYKASTWQYPEFAQRKPVFLELLSRIEDREWFGVQFDPSNALVAGEDSAAFLAEVVDRVFTMQASDRYLADGASLDALRLADGTIGYSPDLRHGVIGRGLNDYPRIFETLRGAGYDGWISIEDGVNGLGEMAESAAFLRAARDEWFGGSKDVDVAARRRATEEA